MVVIGISIFINKAKKAELKKIRVNKTLSWDDAVKIAKKNGGRLPTRRELMNAGVNKASVRYKGTTDFWHPVTRTDGRKNDWVQIGKWGNSNKCPKYCSHKQTFRAFPNWGRGRRAYRFRINGKTGRNFLYIKS
jgi:hypothetical protein